jgi:hypothetical protein
MTAERRKVAASKTSRSKAFFRWRRTKKTIKKESRATPAMPPAILPTMAPALIPETGAEDGVELAGTVSEVAVTVRVLLRWVVGCNVVGVTDEMDDGGGIAVTTGMLLLLVVTGGGGSDVVVGGTGSGVSVVVGLTRVLVRGEVGMGSRVIDENIGGITKVGISPLWGFCRARRLLRWCTTRFWNWWAIVLRE